MGNQVTTYSPIVIAPSVPVNPSSMEPDYEALTDLSFQGPGSEDLVNARAKYPSTTVIRGHSIFDAQPVMQGFMDKLDPVAIMGMGSNAGAAAGGTPPLLGEYITAMNGAVTLMHLPYLNGPLVPYSDTSGLPTGLLTSVANQATWPPDGTHGASLASVNTANASGLYPLGIDPGTGGVLFTAGVANKTDFLGVPIKLTDNDWMLSVWFVIPQTTAFTSLTTSQVIFSLGSNIAVGTTRAVSVVGYVFMDVAGGNVPMLSIDINLTSPDGSVVTITTPAISVSTGLNAVALQYSNDGQSISLTTTDINFNSTSEAFPAPYGYHSLNLVTTSNPYVSSNAFMMFGGGDGVKYGYGTFSFIALRMLFQDLSITGGEGAMEVVSELTFMKNVFGNYSSSLDDNSGTPEPIVATISPPTFGYQTPGA